MGQGQCSSPQAHQVWAGHLSPRFSFFLATGPAVRTGRGWEGARSPSVLGSSKSEPTQSKDVDIPEQKSLLLKHRAEEKVLEEPPGWNSPLFLAGFLVRTQNIHSQWLGKAGMAAVAYGHAPNTQCPLTHGWCPLTPPAHPGKAMFSTACTGSGPSIHWWAPALWLVPAESLPL